MRTDLFDYDLPEELIAQKSIEPRDHSRLLVLDRNSGEMKHEQFFDIVREFRSGDVLVMNKTKVFKARLRGSVDGTNVEVFLLRPRDEMWEAMLQPGKKVSVGDTIDVHGHTAEVVEKSDTFLLKFAIDQDAVLALTEKHGEIPIPPYVSKQPDSLEAYQTVYAEATGSVAAPTAGFHFTRDLIEQLKDKGVQFEFVTLHVGIGTFRPVKTDTLEEHEMHAEFVEIDAGTASRIRRAKDGGRRVFAVGTTTVRALEGTGVPPEGFVGDVNVFIKPGFHFKIIDGLITNFHLPKSTLIVLVSAFVTREKILAAYKEAVRQQYRFYSFGDAMFIR